MEPGLIKYMTSVFDNQKDEYNKKVDIINALIIEYQKLFEKPVPAHLLIRVNKHSIDYHISNIQNAINKNEELK